MLAIFMFATTIFLGLGVRHFERPLYYGMNNRNSNFQDYDYMWNGMWLILITMTTVGYGDFYPKTHIGRFICIVASFLGVFLVSSIVMILSLTTTFNLKEEKAYNILYRLNIKEKVKVKAARVIFNLMKLNLISKKCGRTSKFKKVNKFKIKKAEFKSKLKVSLTFLREALNMLEGFQIPPEEIIRQLSELIDRNIYEINEMLNCFQELNRQLNEIEHKQSNILENLDKSIDSTKTFQKLIKDFKSSITKK